MGLKRVSKVVRVVRQIDRAMTAKHPRTNFQECMSKTNVTGATKPARQQNFRENADKCKGQKGFRKDKDK